MQLLPRVDPVMADEVRLLGEGLPAVGALVRFPPSVGLPVRQEAGVLGGGVPALRAAVALLPGVSPPMQDEVELLEKGLSAVAAAVRLLPRVDSGVDEETRFPGEGRPAFPAAVRLLPRVGAMVLDEARLVGGFLALGTPVRLCSRVNCPRDTEACLLEDRFTPSAVSTGFLLCVSSPFVGQTFSLEPRPRSLHAKDFSAVWTP